MSTKKKIHVIINPAAGRDRPVLNTLNGIFGQAGIDWNVSITKAAGDAQRQASEAARNGNDIVAVYGGDGTVTEAAAGLRDTNVPLALLPGGTANAIAQALGIPADLTAAATLAANGEGIVRSVDLGQIDHRHFLIAIGVGIPGALAEGADRDAKDRLGMFAYALSSLQAVLKAQVAEYHLTLDGKEVLSEGVMCVVANAGQFGIAGLNLSPAIDMGDGLLDVLVIRSADLQALLALAASVVRQDVTAPPLQHWQARTVSVVTDPPQPIQADGEVIEPGPITATVLPCATRFIVPAANEQA